MTGRMIRMRLGVDQQAHRKRRELFDEGADGARIRQIVTAIDQHHAVLRHHDTAVGIEIRADVNVNSVTDLPNVLRQILGRQGADRRPPNMSAKAKTSFNFIAASNLEIDREATRKARRVSNYSARSPCMAGLSAGRSKKRSFSSSPTRLISVRSSARFPLRAGFAPNSSIPNETFSSFG